MFKLKIVVLRSLKTASDKKSQNSKMFVVVIQILATLNNMAIQVVEFSNGGRGGEYKNRKVSA